MKIDFEKGGGLIPAVVQDEATGKVLMLGYMNAEAYRRTCDEKRVTFFSRSKNRLWTKGETSGNFLEVGSIAVDCDGDTLLIKVTPRGPVCHNGSDTCFGERNVASCAGFINELESLIRDRKRTPLPGSYTAELFAKGTAAIAQKVGEEAVETVIEAMKDGSGRLQEEAADLVYHLLVLLTERGSSLAAVEDVLRMRHRSKSETE